VWWWWLYRTELVSKFSYFWHNKFWCFFIYYLRSVRGLLRRSWFIFLLLWCQLLEVFVFPIFTLQSSWNIINQIVNSLNQEAILRNFEHCKEQTEDIEEADGKPTLKLLNIDKTLHPLVKLEEGERVRGRWSTNKEEERDSLFLLVTNFIVYVTVQTRMGKLSNLKRVTGKKTVSSVCNKRITW